MTATHCSRSDNQKKKWDPWLCVVRYNVAVFSPVIPTPLSSSLEFQHHCIVGPDGMHRAPQRPACSTTH